MIMETACCGTTLRIASLILLYLNLIGNVWELLSIGLSDTADASYKQFLQGEVGFYFDIVLMITETLIYLSAIIAISYRKVSTCLLTVTVTCLLLDIFYLLYSMIKLSSDNNRDKLLRILLKKSAFIDAHPDLIMFLFYLFLLAVLAFKFYSAFVFHGYKVELKEGLIYDGPVRQNTIDKDVNLYTPYGDNFQYAAPLLKLALYISK